MRPRPFLLPSLLAAAGLLALASCDGAFGDSNDCVGKCDGLGDSAGGGRVMQRMPEQPGTIEISRAADDWLCEVVGEKAEVVLLSEVYANRANALNGALAIEENGVLRERFRVLQNGTGWSFELLAGNNVVLAESQQFSSQAAAEAGADRARDLVAGIVQYKAARTSGAHFALDRDGSAWQFALNDERGAPLLASQDYSRRRDAITGIESVRNNGKNPARYQVLDGPPRFILKASNGREIGTSAQTFDTVAAAQAAADQLNALLTSERVANPW